MLVVLVVLLFPGGPLGRGEHGKRRAKPGFPLVFEKDKLFHGVFPDNQDEPALFQPGLSQNSADVIQLGRKLA